MIKYFACFFQTIQGSGQIVFSKFGRTLRLRLFARPRGRARRRAMDRAAVFLQPDRPSCHHHLHPFSRIPIYSAWDLRRELWNARGHFPQDSSHILVYRVTA